MKLKMVCFAKNLHHTDAKGGDVIMVQFSVEGGIGTLHTYLSSEDAKQYELGSKYVLSLDAVVVGP